MGLGIVTLWFLKRNGAGSPFSLRNRVVLLFLTFVCTYIVARVIQTLIHHPRPIVSTAIETTSDEIWSAGRSFFTDWGSFPSDHVALYFIFAVFLFTVNRGLGILTAVIGAYLGILRVGLGFHWPSDALGGAVLGLLVAVAVLSLEPVLTPRLDRLVSLFEKYPAVAYGAGFVILSDFVQNFRYTRPLFSLIFHRSLFH